ncbi:MAG: ABC transporter ATP-binding protein [Patescibacteria group bacterium]
MGVLKFIYKNLNQFKTRFVLVFFAGIFDGLTTFFIPVVLAEFTKSSFTSNDFQNLISLVIVFYLASLFLQWIIRRWGEAIGPQFGNYIRLKYFKALEKLPIKDLINHHSGYILSLINKVSDGLTPIMFDIFGTFAKSISNMTLFFYFIARESIFIAIINLIVLTIFLIISTILSRKMVPIANELNKKRASLLESYADFISNILTIKRLGIYSFVENKLFHKTDENYDQIQKLQNFHADRWFFLHVLFGFAFLSTIGFLLFQVSKGTISASVLILFIAAYTMVKGNIERLSENFKSLMEMKAYINSLDKIISPSELINENKEIQKWEEIKFSEVFFQYPETQKKISIPNFVIKSGEKICVIGKSGEGKTTFLNLFTNFLKPDKGGRLIDGQLYEKISGKFFQKRVTVISQETELFNISLRENITLGQKIEEKIIFEIFDKLDLLTWVQNLEDGLETIVGEKGIKLSAGQKQRINLIRGVLLNREIVLLDEPTSHLDSITEKKVIDFLTDYLSGKTAIIVSHREALREICDRCYIIKDHFLTEIKSYRRKSDFRQ